jgi:hypothetical protein
MYAKLKSWAGIDNRLKAGYYIEFLKLKLAYARNCNSNIH